MTQLTSCTTSDATLTFEDKQTNAIRAHLKIMRMQILRE